MNALILLSILLSAALGIARGADLAFGTDAVTGLCTVGSVWWRYAALGAVVLAAVLIGRHCAGKAETVRSRQPLAGVLAFAGAVCFLAAAGAQLAVGLSATSSFVRSILECICAVWLSTLGRCWLTPSGWKKPTGGLYLADLVIDVFLARQSAFEGFAGQALQVVACIGDMVCPRHAVTEPPDGLHDLGLRVYCRKGGTHYIRQQDYMGFVV